MEDWLATFGTFALNLPAGIGAGNYFLPVNNKSLVVSHPNPPNPPSLAHSSPWFHLSVYFVWQVSILSAGTFFGALFAFHMGDLVGRKWGIVVSCMIFSLGIGLQLDTHWPTFIVGRVIAGIGVVCRAVCVPCAILWPPSFLGSRLMFSPHVSIRGI
jgi:MFS transporter, SP family, sugar:H+ symporter